MPPDPPSKERLRRSLVRIINWSHPPVKNPGYGPDHNDYEKRYQYSENKTPVKNNCTMTKSLRREPVNPKHNAAEILCLEHNSEAPWAAGWSK